MQVFNPNEPKINLNDFPKLDWSHTVYADGRGEFVEEVPKDLPKLLGIEFVMRMLVDSDHAGNQVTCRSRTGFLVFLNSSLIIYCIGLLRSKQLSKRCRLEVSSWR